MKLDDTLLKKYAQVMVHYALNNGNGIKKGDTVFLVGQECTKDLFMMIAKEVYKAGGNLITHYQPNAEKENSLARFLLESGSDDQIGFFATPYWQGIVDATDHILFIISEPDIHYLEGLPAAKISRLNSARAPYMKMREKKEQQGNCPGHFVFMVHNRWRMKQSFLWRNIGCRSLKLVIYGKKIRWGNGKRYKRKLKK